MRSARSYIGNVCCFVACNFLKCYCGNHLLCNQVGIRQLFRDFFHISVIRKEPYCKYSVVYKVEEPISDSSFVRVEDHESGLYLPGKSPRWIGITLELQKDNLDQARQYTYNKIKAVSDDQNYDISLGFNWSNSSYDTDSFMDNIMDLASFE